MFCWSVSLHRRGTAANRKKSAGERRPLSRRARWLHRAVAAAVAITVCLCAIPAVHARRTDAPEDSVTLPIVMYHSFSQKSARQGRYVISPAVLENDLRWLTEHGYTAVLMRDVLAWSEHGTPLPDRPIVLSFDDGNYDNYLYAYPLMEKYDSRMVLAPIGAAVDRFTAVDDRNPDYAACSWDVLREMVASGRVEVQNHTYDLHHLGTRRGCRQCSGESLEHYSRLLLDDVGQMQRAVTDHLGVTPTTFVYPYGAISRSAAPLLKEMGFRASFSCEGRLNHITHEADSLWELGRFIRTASPDSDTYFKKILTE